MFTLFRKRNERFYESGRMIVGLIERCSSVVAQAIATTPGKRNTRRNAHTAAMARVNQEAMELRRTLLVVCTHCCCFVRRKLLAGLIHSHPSFSFPKTDIYRGTTPKDARLVHEQCWG